MTTINLKDFYSWYVTDEYIAPMVNSMEKMDTIQQRLEAMHQSLQAARQLRNEYMDSQDYYKAISEKQINVERLRQLEQISCPLLQPTAQAILQTKRPGYQDALAEEYLEDLQKAENR